MTKISKIIFGASLLVLVTSLASARGSGGQEVGNGGDPLKLIFSKARVDAIAASKSFTGLDPHKSFSQDVFLFLHQTLDGEKKVYEHIPLDIEASIHKWIDPEIDGIQQSTCARTNLPDEDPKLLRFSYSNCRTLVRDNGQEYSTKLLIHEATHHLGLSGSTTDENLADKVANQLYHFWQLERDINSPFWKSTPLRNGPASRSQHASALVHSPAMGSSLFIWGGCNYSKLPNRESCEKYLNDGYLLNFGSTPHRWKKISSKSAPSRRKLANSIFTGPHPSPSFDEKIIVFGGCYGKTSSCSKNLASGSVYDPKRDSWKPLPISPQLEGRKSHSMVWTQKGLLIWGGIGNQKKVFADGFFLEADSNPKWKKISLKDAPEPRFGHATAWTGRNLLIWGGCARPGLFNCQDIRTDGFAYDPELDQWDALPPIPFEFEPRVEFASVWTGRYLVIWGGRKSRNQVLNDGIMYDSLNRNWIMLSDLLPEGEKGRYQHQITYSGNEILVYGGLYRPGKFAKGILKLDWLDSNPGEQSWSKVATDTLPIGRKGHSQNWIDDRFVIWGGFSADQTYLPTGGILTNLYAQ